MRQSNIIFYQKQGQSNVNILSQARGGRPSNINILKVSFFDNEKLKIKCHLSKLVFVITLIFRLA